MISLSFPVHDFRWRHFRWCNFRWCNFRWRHFRWCNFRWRHDPHRSPTNTRWMVLLYYWHTMYFYLYHASIKLRKGWSWSYASWIYPYLCSQCGLWIWIPVRWWILDFESGSSEVYSIQHYVINFAVTCDRSVVFFSMYSGFLHQ